MPWWFVAMFVVAIFCILVSVSTLEFKSKKVPVATPDPLVEGLQKRVESTLNCEYTHELLHGVYLTQRMLDNAADCELYEDLYEQHPELRKAFEKASEALGDFYQAIGNLL